MSPSPLILPAVSPLILPAASPLIAAGGGGGTAFSFSFLSSLPPGINFARASGATQWNGAAIVSVGSNVPRIEPAGGYLTGFGLLLEAQATNIFLNSQSPVTQGCATTAQQYTISGFGAAGATITLSGTAGGTLTGTGAGNLVQTTVTATAGTLTCTLSGTWNNVQVEAGAFASSRIITLGSVITRAADALWFNPATLTPGLQSAAGLSLVLGFDALTFNASLPVMLGVCGAGGYATGCIYGAPGPYASSLTIVSGAQQPGNVVTPLTVGTAAKFGFSAASAGAVNVAVNGTPATAGSTPALPRETAVSIGSCPWGPGGNVQPCHAHFITGYSGALSPAALSVVTT